MLVNHHIPLSDSGAQSVSGDRVLSVTVGSEASNPIVVLVTSRDPEGSSFDLRKALLLRKGHDFTREQLRELAAIIQVRRNAAQSEGSPGLPSVPAGAGAA